MPPAPPRSARILGRSLRHSHGRSPRRVAALVLAVRLLLPAMAAPVHADEGRYQLPVSGGILRRFEPTVGPYGPGHRGVDVDASVGTAVRAAADGTVAWIVQHALPRRERQSTDGPALPADTAELERLTDALIVEWERRLNAKTAA